MPVETGYAWRPVPGLISVSCAPPRPYSRRGRRPWGEGRIFRGRLPLSAGGARFRRWLVRLGALVVVLRVMGGVEGAERGGEESGDPPAERLPSGTVDEPSARTLVEPDSGWVIEAELAPALDSNRLPMGPDPLEFPQWPAEEVAAFEAGRPVNLGGGLWSPERYPLQPAPPWPTVAVPELPPWPGVLSWELMSRFSASSDWCVDPQRVLDDAVRTTLETHLAAHARAAYHPVRLWLLAGGQSLAQGLEEDVLHRAAFGPDRPGVLVVCAVDDPMAARLVVPPVLGMRGGTWWHGVVRRVPPRPAVSPGAQLSQMVLWLTLEADELPAIEAGAGAAGWMAADAADAAGATVRLSPRAWWPAAAIPVVAVLALVWWRRRR